MCNKWGKSHPTYFTSQVTASLVRFASSNHLQWRAVVHKMNPPFFYFSLSPCGVYPSISSTFSQPTTGFAIFRSGLIVGICNLLCGISVGVTGLNAALADAADQTLFVRILIVEVSGSIMGLFGLIGESGRFVDTGLLSCFASDRR
jgi:F0F1-type ATP synthase membrane subunit c/vacuolar-type H+-ATPase subunit K